ncbi:MAG: coenzyme F420-0:L-glutamate ligase [Brevibacterium yomogidense]|uniref:Coenzyme F420-0:L-glutamate ligase @ Coenzyme F420-1:L-glutamate ligase n=1 Tax=Brevibacterium yomogidense TaxID=946573 RepID=A0A1X6XPT2_9MICO|nr:coenzyme F420-0:L-glutamate ligase [Brevibacterium yomogidense]SLN01146.1 Coenzyme F420-0:L-glutamate ligase @ Coenzyme F420-1:L-glutamate ligase [Brevibacterium yomogidense]
MTSSPSAPHRRAESSRLLTAYAVPGIGRIGPGTDLGREIGGAITASGLDLKDGDVLVVASKVVAKAENSLARAATRQDFERLVDAHSRHTVVRRRYSSGVTVNVVRTASGTVQAAAGLDQSNTDGDDDVLLHPQDPDASAARLRDAFSHRFGVRLGVLVSDTTSRPWRVGVSDFVLGCAGIDPLDSQRGEPDDAGRPQQVTVRAVADAIAQAADLVKGSARGRPVAIVRGVSEVVTDAGPGAAGLSRPLSDDWFRTGHVEAAWTALGVDPADPGITPPSGDDSDDILARATRALAVARGGAPRTPGQAGWRLTLTGSGSAIRVRPRPETGRSESSGHPLVEAAVGLGSLIERIATALAAEDLRCETDWIWQDSGAPGGADLRIELTPTPTGS